MNKRSDEADSSRSETREEQTEKEQTSLQKDVKKLWKEVESYAHLFLNISWIVSLVLSCKDSSVCADDIHPTILFTYR